ncbi:T9SS type A sorting domain-containing protein [candidate division WOR-3 bacterium]|nr:T9SS type A sorting domain-containing protein [candidate division WOR-3 bacterium]
MSGVALGKVIIQTDWHGGPGGAGPVDDWGTSFESTTATNYLYQYGRLSLEAVINSDPVDHFVSDETGYSIQTCDMDYDGDYDVVSAGEWNERVVWFENTDGEGTFSGIPNTVLTAPEPEFLAADLDHDGYTDIIYIDEELVYWYRNNHDGTFMQTVVGEHLKGDALGVADFDNDGDADIVTAGRDTQPALYWFENDGTCDFTRHEIASSYSGPTTYIPTADFDADGFTDFVISGEEDANLDWWGDEKGPSEFTSHNLATQYEKDFHSSFTWVSDLDKDGDLDIVATASKDHNLAWWENDGKGYFVRRDISWDTKKGYGVATLDMDYDGDIDVVTASKNGKHMSWWENDGAQNFTQRIFPGGGYYNCWAVWAADISGNGFVDVLSIPGGDGPPSSTYWWEMFDHFVPTAELTSCVYDAGTPGTWESIDWNAQLNNGGKVQFLLRTSNDAGDFPDWNACDTIETPGSLGTYVDQNTRYLQYKVILSSTNDQYSPLLHEIRFNYTNGTDAREVVPVTSYRLRIVDNTIHYSLPCSKIAQLTIFDAVGRRIRAMPLNGSGSLEVKELPKGLYFVLLEHEAGSISCKLILVH